jgi:translation initiation factor 1A
MPPNAKGGKQYKKKAKGAEDPDSLFIEQQEGQQIARVIRPLGNRNMTCYCNDNKIRVCHVRGKMRGRVFVEKGDMVLISLREFEIGASKTDVGGDIIAKYPYESLSRLRKQEGMNPKLFMQLDILDGTKLAEIGGEDGWEFDREDEEGANEDEEGANEEKPATTKSKDDDDDNIDIDAI